MFRSSCPRVSIPLAVLAVVAALAVTAAPAAASSADHAAPAGAARSLQLRFTFTQLAPESRAKVTFSSGARAIRGNATARISSSGTIRSFVSKARGFEISASEDGTLAAYVDEEVIPADGASTIEGSATVPAGASLTVQAGSARAIPVSGRFTIRVATPGGVRPKAKRNRRQNRRTVRLELGRAVSLRTLRVVPRRRVSRRLRTAAARGWRLAAKPPRSKRKLRRLGRRATTFRPDRRGRYVLVRGRGRGARRLVLHATPAPELVCVNTRAWAGDDPSSAHIRVGGTDYPRSGPGLQVVVLSRANLGEIPGVTANQTFAQDAAGYARYANFLQTLSNTQLVFVSGTVSDSARPSVWGPLARLGAADLPLPFPSTAVPFSFIGIPGLQKGQGWQAVDGNATRPVRSPCDGSLTAEPTNNLAGWLTLDSTGKSYTYVAGDDVEVDTAAPTAAGSHAIQVGNQTYTIPLGSHANGWHALVLERASLCPAQAAPAACSPPDPLLNFGVSQDGGGFDALATALKPFVGNPDTLLILAPFVGSNGRIANADPPATLVGALRDFGSSILAPGRAFETADSRYSLIGGGDRFSLPAGSAPPESAESFTGFGDSGRIAGYLTRDNQNRYGPGRTAAAGDAVQGLRAIAYAPPTPWPATTSSPGFAFLSAKIGYAVTATNPLGIRGAYDEPVVWSDVLSDLAQWKKWSDLTPAQQQTAGSDAGAYAAVYKELHDEIEETANVHEWITKLQAVYLGSAAYNLKPLVDQVVNQIKATYPPPEEQSELGVDLTKLFFSVASVLPEIGEVIDVAGEALDVGLDIARDANGKPQDVRGQTFDKGQDMVDAALNFISSSSTSLNHLAAIVTEDPRKLEIVGTKTGPIGDVETTSDAEHPWIISDGDELNSLQGAVTNGLTRWLMPDVVGAGFKVWQVQIPSDGGDILNGGDATPVTYKCGNDDTLFPDITHPFGLVPDPDGWMKLWNGTYWSSLVLAGIRYSSTDLELNHHHAPPPSQALLNTLFGTGPNQLAFSRAWFFEQGFAETIGGQYFVDC
jgi:hypothetical protein